MQFDALSKEHKDLSGRLAEVQSSQLSAESQHYQQLSDLQEINSGLQQVCYVTQHKISMQKGKADWTHIEEVIE